MLEILNAKIMAGDPCKRTQQKQAATYDSPLLFFPLRYAH